MRSILLRAAKKADGINNRKGQKKKGTEGGPAIGRRED